MTRCVQNTLFSSSVCGIHTAIHNCVEQIRLRNLVYVRTAAKRKAASLVSASSPWRPVRIAPTRAALELYAIHFFSWIIELGTLCLVYILCSLMWQGDCDWRIVESCWEKQFWPISYHFKELKFKNRFNKEKMLVVLLHSYGSVYSI